MKYILQPLMVALLCCLLPHCIVAQSNSIIGKVVDATTQEPLVWVNVYLKRAQQATATKADGSYSLLAAPNDSVYISYVGYETQQYASTAVPAVVALVPTSAAMSEVVVSASRAEQKRSEVPASITTLTATTIEQTRATSLDQLLNKTPGVFMVNLGNEQHSMSIRQPLSYKSLFLYLEDGLPIRPTGVFNHNALLEINQANVGQIEVIRGPSSSLYGSEAIGGAINFITLRPTATPTASIRLQGNNLGYKRADVRGAATFGKLGLALSGYYANRTNGFRDHSDFSKLAASLKLTYALSDRDFLSADATYIDYQSDMTGSLDSAQFYSRSYGSLQTFTRRKVQAFRSKLQYRRYWNDNSKTVATVFFRANTIAQIPSYRIRDDWSPWRNPTGDRSLAHGENNDNSYQSIGALVQHRQTFDFWKTTVTAGAYLDYSPNSYRAHYIAITRNEEGGYTNYTDYTDSLLTNYHVGLLNPAGYVQVETRPFKGFQLTAALRYDAFVYNYDNFLPPIAFSGAPDNVDNFQALTPKIGATYSFSQQFGLYANYSQGFVPPQIGELYRGVSVPVLQPATYVNYEVGGWLSILKNKVRLDWSAYWMNGYNEIISVQQDNGERRNQNAGETRHYGVEYGLHITPVKGLLIRLSGTNAVHEFVQYVERGADFSGMRMPQAPSWIANAEVVYQFQAIKGLRLSVEMLHMSSYFMNELNTKTYPGFTVFNARAGYSFKGFEIWCNVLNFTNRLYSPNARLSRWGQSYTVGAPLSLNIGLGYQFIGKKVL